MANSDTTYATGDTIDYRTNTGHEDEYFPIIPIKKQTSNKRIDRLVQKAEAAQRQAKMGRWR